MFSVIGIATKALGIIGPVGGVFMAVAAFQYFQINGFLFFDGYKDQVEDLIDDIENPETGYLKQLKDKDIEIDTVTRNRDALQQAIRDRNAEVEQLREQFEKASEQADEAVRQAKVASEANRREIIENEVIGPTQMNDFFAETFAP